VFDKHSANNNNILYITTHDRILGKITREGCVIEVHLFHHHRDWCRSLSPCKQSSQLQCLIDISKYNYQWHRYICREKMLACQQWRIT